jgi:GTPase SAR1 family protein
MLGASGAGKTTLSTKMKEHWNDRSVVVRPEVGGLLREASVTGSNVFELSFELALLNLEHANYLDIANIAHREPCDLVIVDGGMFQNLTHITNRTTRVDEKLQDIITDKYKELILYWIKFFPNSYFLVLKHRMPKFDVNKFEKQQIAFLTYTENIGEGLDAEYVAERLCQVDPMTVTDLIQQPDRFGDMEEFLVEVKQRNFYDWNH